MVTEEEEAECQKAFDQLKTTMIKGVTRCPWVGLATNMIGACCVPPCPSIKRRMFFIAHVLLLLTTCLFACHAMSHCLLCAWLIVGLLCGYPLLDILALYLIDALLLPLCMEMLAASLTNGFALELCVLTSAAHSVHLD